MKKVMNKIALVMGTMFVVSLFVGGIDLTLFNPFTGAETVINIFG